MFLLVAIIGVLYAIALTDFDCRIQATEKRIAEVEARLDELAFENVILKEEASDYRQTIETLNEEVSSLATDATYFESLGEFIITYYTQGEAEVGDSINLGQLNSRTRRGRVGKGCAQTLTTQAEQATFDGMDIRKLTPRESFRLQGFPDEYFEAAEAVCSNEQLYKQAGNSVTVSVVYEIARRLPLKG
jgi:site-specific DNA-cytosine methylase